VQTGTTQLRRAPMTPVKQMQRALADAVLSPQRMSLIPGGPVEPTPLPDLVALYARAIDQDSQTSGASLTADLADADDCLATFRTELQARVDRVTMEIILRYREEPSLALLLLPPIGGSSMSRTGQSAVHTQHDGGARRGMRAT
jgi:hypothetical protein